MTIIEKKIESAQEYNLLKLLKANTNPNQYGFQYVHLEHDLCRAFASNSYAIVIADLEPNWWQDIFGSLPEFVYITNLNKDRFIYSDGEKLDKFLYQKIFEAAGKEPEYQPVTHFDLKLLRNLIDKFDDVYFVKGAGQALYMQLEGDKYPHGKYYAAIMPMTITKEQADKIIEALGSLAIAAAAENRRRWVADKREIAA